MKGKDKSKRKEEEKRESGNEGGMEEKEVYINKMCIYMGNMAMIHVYCMYKMKSNGKNFQTMSKRGYTHMATSV